MHNEYFSMHFKYTGAFFQLIDKLPCSSIIYGGSKHVAKMPQIFQEDSTHEDKI